ncbi:hypothetical protein [Pacificoceanicola onchidii]|uniref:hypothetical protein n=1 Tax=Pacificoceanicola onchidii TaxID=2562685 RepID=UPI0010A4959E|nr:hypothetical protein [Pacificoceanicola onchidii]
MVPDFALSLSFEGIALLRHVDGRWARISEVALDVPDLDAAVNALRDQALALDPEGGKVVLVIPNEQIRFLDTPDPGGPAAARTEAVQQALEGATPYQVDELVFDQVVDRGRILIAAVARETLDEAESFAKTHGFDGVSHAAIAPEGAFKGAVHFGKVKSWKGRVKRLAAPIEIVEADEAALTPVPPPPQAELDLPVETAPEPVVAPEPVPEVAPEPEVQAKPEPAPEPEPTPEPEPKPEPVVLTAEDAPHEEPPQAVPVTPPELTPGDPDAGASLYFSTVREALSETDTASTPEIPQSEHKPRFTPVVQTPARAPEPASEPAAEPVPEPEAKQEQAEPPKADTPPAPAKKAEPKAPDAARARALALAARTPGAPVDAPAKPQPPKAPAPELAQSLTAPRAGEDAPDSAETAKKGGAVAGAMRFLSRRGQGKTDKTEKAAPEAPARAVPKLDSGRAAPAPAGPTLSAKPVPKAPVAEPAPAPEIPAPDPALAAPASEPPSNGALAKIAARRPAPDAAARKTPPAPPMPAKGAPVAAQSEAERMTVFGARGQEIGGKPRYLGLMLTATLLLFLVGVAAWASVFMQDGLAGLFGSDEPEAVASLPEGTATIPSADPETPLARAPATEEESAEAEDEVAEDLQVASLGLGTPVPSPAPRPTQPIAPQAAPTPEEAAATYAATGVWLRAPSAPLTPPEDAIDEVYAASLDPTVMKSDAVALPGAAEIGPEFAMLDPGLPPPAGMVFNFDPRGLIRATPEGALSPDGLRIYTGRPPVVPPLRGVAAAPPPVPGTDAAGETENPLSRVRPEARPDDIVEQRERATQTGISNAELAALRPVMRPRTEQEVAVEEEPEAPATDRAIARSLVPVTRPRNMQAIVRRAERSRPAEPVQTASAAAIAPRTVQPSGTTAGSVARSATVRNAINLSKVSLIGIYGTPSNRRALVRLPSGSYKKVKVGDRIDGGRVASISESELRYTKGGRNMTLKMPRG